MSALRLEGKTPLFTPKESRIYYLDFLPYKILSPNHPDIDEGSGITVGEMWYKRPYGVHRRPPVVCPRLSTNTENCPVCKHHHRLDRERSSRRAASRPITKQMEALRASSRTLYIVVPKNDPDFEEKPHIWDIAVSGFQSLLYDYIGENEQYADFPDPDNGYTLKILLKSKRFGYVQFVEAEKIAFIKRDTNEILRVQKHLKDVPNLDVAVESGLRESAQKLSSYKPSKIKHTPIERTTNNRSKSTLTATARELNEALGLRPPIDIKASPRTIERLVREAVGLVLPEDLPFLSTDTRKVVVGEESRRGNGKSSKDECPSGYRFGIDTDDYDECDDCPVWEACIDAKEYMDMGESGPESRILTPLTAESRFVSFTEIATRETGRRLLGVKTKRNVSNPDNVTWAIHQKPNELMFRVIFGSSICARERMIVSDKVDMQVDLDRGEILIKRDPNGPYSLCLRSKRDREQYAEDPSLAMPLIVSARLFPGFPYSQFSVSMPAVVLKHRHGEQGLVLTLVRHPNAKSNEPGW